MQEKFHSQFPSKREREKGIEAGAREKDLRLEAERSGRKRHQLGKERLSRTETSLETAEQKQEKERDIRKLSKFLERVSEELNKEGIPLDNACRIDMEAFAGIYVREDIESNKRYIVNWREGEWYKNLSPEEIEKKKLEEPGEQFEMLKTAVLYKFLRKDFIVVRASRYDDIKNGADNVIVERTTGNLVCAVDEVTFTERASEKVTAGIKIEKSKGLSRKEEKVWRKNREEGGAKIKYGVSIKDDKLVMGEFENLPIFYFALPKGDLEEGIKKLIPFVGQKSSEERKLFVHFLSSMRSQTESLQSVPKLSPDLKKNLEQYNEALKRLKEY